MSRKIDITGNKYNLLTVLEEAGRHPTTNNVQWKCRCDCGTEVVVAGNNLKNGHTKSCGCVKKASWASVITTHGLSRLHKVEYLLWKNMRSRCENENTAGFNRYGARGIYVAPEWSDFERFFADMGARPGPEYSIERIDNDGPYGPGNCRWATRKEQANNRSSSRWVEYRGERLTLSQFSEATGIRYEALQHQLKKGLTPEAAIQRIRTHLPHHILTT